MYHAHDRATQAHRVTLYSSLCNFVLICFKLAAGILGKSTALIADAVHSISDFATDLVVVVSMWMTKKPRDKSHDYGHGKFETFAALLIGISLFIVGIGIGWNGIKNIIRFYQGTAIASPGYIALIAAGVSIIVKEILYRWTLRVGRRIDSQAVIANAWHHRSDALSSIGVLFGIGGAIALGDRWRVLDPLAGIIVALFILQVGIKISLKSINELLESSLSDEEEATVIDLIKSVTGAKDPHNLKTRRIGNNISIDIHVRVDSEMNIRQGHEIATDIEVVLREHYGPDTFVSVHIEPG